MIGAEIEGRDDRGTPYEWHCRAAAVCILKTPSDVFRGRGAEVGGTTWWLQPYPPPKLQQPRPDPTVWARSLQMSSIS